MYVVMNERLSKVFYGVLLSNIGVEISRWFRGQLMSLNPNKYPPPPHPLIWNPRVLTEERTSQL